MVSYFLGIQIRLIQQMSSNSIDSKSLIRQMNIFLFFILLFLFLCNSFLLAKQNDDDLSRKVEGSYFTGIPLINFSSDDGLGYGVRFYYYNNGSKTAPDFINNPYNSQVYCQLFRTTEGYQYHEVDFDTFNIFNTGFRVQTSLSYEGRRNSNFYGTGAAAARQKLTDANGNTYDTYSEYEKNFLKANDNSDFKYNKFTLRSPEYCLDMYRDITEYFKFLFGFNFRYVDITPWDGRKFTLGIFERDKFIQTQPTLLTIMHPTGYKGGWTNFARAGIAYDTRDFEPDPNKGVYIDYVFDIDNQVLGSDYNFHRSTAGARFYYNPYKPVVITGRIAYTSANGNVPFYEMNTFSFFYNRYNGLGGYRTLRGYEQDRFVGPTMIMGNLEIRYHIANIAKFGQDFKIKVVGFTDTGNVYDKAKDPITNTRLGDYKLGYGGGFVIAWNMNTIIHSYFGFSREDWSVSINFNHSLD
jgi:hypothetical protein